MNISMLHYIAVGFGVCTASESKATRSMYRVLNLAALIGSANFSKPESEAYFPSVVTESVFFSSAASNG